MRVRAMIALAQPCLDSFFALFGRQAGDEHRVVADLYDLFVVRLYVALERVAEHAAQQHHQQDRHDVHQRNDCMRHQVLSRSARLQTSQVAHSPEQERQKKARRLRIQ